MSRTRRVATTNTADLTTEQFHPATKNLDKLSSLQLAARMNAEDAKVARAVRKALPQIAKAIDVVADGLSRGGRLIYVGTGTSGRLGALDSVECPPTFNCDARTVQFVIAGGRRALAEAIEADEDSREQGERDMTKRKPGPKDTVVGIAASGRTPYTVAALEFAKAHRAQTVAVVCNRGTPLAKVADIAIVAEVGPEVVSGSTRLKAGTAQKMILNTLSTGAMARLGRVYGNLMVNLRPRNSKLRQRGVRIVQEATASDPRAARLALRRSGDSVPTAIMMLKNGLQRRQAEEALRRANGSLRRALEM